MLAHKLGAMYSVVAGMTRDALRPGTWMFGIAAGLSALLLSGPGMAQEAITVSITSAVAPTPISEGESISFDVTLSGAISANATVPWRIAETGGIAATDVDGALTGNVEFTGGGALTETVTITTADDAVNEPQETLTFTLEAPTGTGVELTATVADRTRSVAILAQTAAVSITSAAVPAPISEGDSISFSVTLSWAIAENATVPWRITETEGFTATDVDGALTGNVEFTSGGDLTQTVTVTIADDMVREPRETLTFTLEAPTGTVVELTPTVADRSRSVTILAQYVAVNFNGNKYRQVREGEVSTLRLQFDMPPPEAVDFHLHVSVDDASFSNNVGGEMVEGDVANGDLAVVELADEISISSPFGELEFLDPLAVGGGTVPANVKRIEFTVPAGVRTYDLRVMAKADNVWEVGRVERFAIEFDAAAHAGDTGADIGVRFDTSFRVGNASEGYSVVEYTIVDATQPNLAVGLSTARVAETDADQLVDVEVGRDIRDGSATIEGALTFAIGITPGLGITSGDYSVPATATVSLADMAEQSGNLALTVIGDDVIETDETITVTAWLVGMPETASLITPATLTITDDDRVASTTAVHLSVSTVPETVTEGHVEPVAVTVTASLAAGETVPTSDLEINLDDNIFEAGVAVVDSRVTGSNVSTNSIPLTIAAGQTSGSVEFNLALAADDMIAEPDSVITIGPGTGTSVAVRATSFVVEDDDAVFVVLEPVPSIHTGVGQVTYTVSVESTSIVRTSDIVVPFAYIGDAVHVSDTDVDGVVADFTFGTPAHAHRNPTLIIPRTAGVAEMDRIHSADIVFNIRNTGDPHNQNRHVAIRFMSPTGGGGRVALGQFDDADAVMPVDQLSASTVLNAVLEPRIRDIRITSTPADANVIGGRGYDVGEKVTFAVEFDQPVKISRQSDGAVPTTAQLPKLQVELESGAIEATTPASDMLTAGDTVLNFEFTVVEGDDVIEEGLFVGVVGHVAGGGIAIPENPLVLPAGTTIHIRDMPGAALPLPDLRFSRKAADPQHKVAGGRIQIYWGTFFGAVATRTREGSGTKPQFGVGILPPLSPGREATITGVLSGAIDDVVPGDNSWMLRNDVKRDGTLVRQAAIPLPASQRTHSIQFRIVDDNIWEGGDGTPAVVRLRLDADSLPGGYRLSPLPLDSVIHALDNDSPPTLRLDLSRSVLSMTSDEDFTGADTVPEGSRLNVDDGRSRVRALLSGPLLEEDLVVRLTFSAALAPSPDGATEYYEVLDESDGRISTTAAAQAQDRYVDLTIPALTSNSQSVYLSPIFRSDWTTTPNSQSGTITARMHQAPSGLTLADATHDFTILRPTLSSGEDNVAVARIEIASVPSTPAGYRAGEQILIEAVLNRLAEVNVPAEADRPTLTIGGFSGTPNTKTATYSGELGKQYTGRVPFVYTVAAGDAATGGISVEENTLTLPNDSTIQSVGASVTSLVGTVLDDSNDQVNSAVALDVDHRVLGTAAPAAVAVVDVSVISTPADSARGGYFKGETIEVRVRFNGNVSVNPRADIPTLALDFSDDLASTDETVQAAYARGSGTLDLVFAHTVTVDNSDLDGLAIPANGLTDAAGAITATNGGTRALTFAARDELAGHRVYGKTVSFEVGAISITEPAPVLELTAPDGVHASNGNSFAVIDDGSTSLTDSANRELLVLVEPRLPSNFECDTTGQPSTNLTWTPSGTSVNEHDYAPINDVGEPTRTSYANNEEGSWIVCLDVPDGAPSVNRSKVGIAVKADVDWEYGVAETVTVAIDANGLPAGYVLGAHGSMIVTIVDNTPPPTPLVQLSETTVSEDASAVADRQFTAKLLIRPPGSATSVIPNANGREVEFALARGSDVTPVDDVTLPATLTGTLTPASGGQESTEITFTVNDDDVVEGSEELYVAATIAGISGTSLPNGQKHLSGPLHIEKGRLIVTETDQLNLTVTVDGDHVAVLEDSNVTFNVNASAAIGDLALKVPILLNDPRGSTDDVITADDFNAPPQLLDLAPNMNGVWPVIISINDDGTTEGVEKFAFQLGQPIGVPRGARVMVGPAVELVIQEGTTLDVTRPTVSTVVISAPGSDYHSSGHEGAGSTTAIAGDTIRITVTFSEDVDVIFDSNDDTTRPGVRLAVGNQDRTAIYESHTDSTVVFAYNLMLDEVDGDGISIPANAITTPAGGAIEDLGKNVADLTHGAVAGKATEPVRARPGMPTNVRTTADSTNPDTTLAIRWDAPSETGGLAISSYIVEWATSATASSWTTVTVDAPNLTTTLGSLSVGDTRHFRVYAVNAVGPSAVSEIVQATTQAATVMFSAPTYEGSESGPIVVTVQLNVVLSSNVEVPFTVIDGTAAVGTDFTISASPVRILAGENTAIVTVTPTDNMDEAEAAGEAKSFTLTLGTPTPTAVSLAAENTMATVTINGDDIPVNLSVVGPAELQEGGVTDLVVTATIPDAAPAPTIDLTVPIQVTDGTTTAAADYAVVNSPAEITIAAGDRRGTMTLQLAVTQDDEAEGAESFQLQANIDPASPYVGGDAADQTIAENEVPGTKPRTAHVHSFQAQFVADATNARVGWSSTAGSYDDATLSSTGFRLPGEATDVTLTELSYGTADGDMIIAYGNTAAPADWRNLQVVVGTITVNLMNAVHAVTEKRFTVTAGNTTPGTDPITISVMRRDEPVALPDVANFTSPEFTKVNWQLPEFTTGNHPATYTLTDTAVLPTGLTWNAASRTISGLPTVAPTGPVSFTLAVNDADGDTHSTDFTITTTELGGLPSIIDVNADGKLTYDDALIMYYVYALPPQVLGTGTDAAPQGAAHFRKTFIGAYLPPGNPHTDAEYRERVRIVNELQQLGFDELLDINGDSTLDESDAVILYWAWAMPELVGRGTDRVPHGFMQYRRELLRPLSTQGALATDLELQGLLQRANDLQELPLR